MLVTAGMFGIKQFAAIVNPPQAAIMAVGATDKKVRYQSTMTAGQASCSRLADRPRCRSLWWPQVVLSKSGDFSEVSVMIVTLSCDHRVIDGAMGAEWLQAFKSFLQEPYNLLL